MLRIKAYNKKPVDQILKEGDHLVKIDSITETCNKDWAQMPWSDRTPQIAIRYKNAVGYITHWINLKGYMTIEDYQDAKSAEASGIIFMKHPFSEIEFAVDLKTNTRIENEDKSRTCMHILGRIGHCCGIPAGEEINLIDLIGKDLAIRIEKKSGQLKVTHTFKKV
jgi:hypothetical protein